MRNNTYALKRTEGLEISSLFAYTIRKGSGENMKYRKKPAVIEAFQYDGDLKGGDGNYYIPEWAVKAFENGTMRYKGGISPLHPPCELYIETLEGVMHANVGDYIIQGVNGEIYPCKADIFEKTYERVEE